MINLGLFVRAVHVATGDGFPLNDGGMFYAMVNDIVHAGFALPQYTSYNGGDIPFAYPPLGFYLAAALSQAFGWSVLDLLRFLPLLASVLTIPAFYLLARRLIPDSSTALMAMLLFALAPRAFNWEIAGGGLTRSFGLLFAILAIAEGLQLIREGGRARLAMTALLGALTLATHMEMALIAAYSLGFLYLAQGRSVRAMRDLVIAGLLAVLLTAPWWGLVIERHGMAPFLSAAQAGNQSLVAWLRLPLYNFTEEPLFPIVGALGLLGIIYSIATRQYLLPLWLLVIFVIDPRKAATFGMVPLTILGALGLTEALLPMFSATRPPGVVAMKAPELHPRAAAIAVAAIVLYGAISSILIISDRTSVLHAVPGETRQAMQWIKSNTEPDARFAVVTGRELWGRDSASEWFPELAGRISIATVQGSEWGGAEAFGVRENAHKSLQECSTKDAGCLTAWAREKRESFSYVFLPNEKDWPKGQLTNCCPTLRSALLGSAQYVLVFDGQGGSVFRLRYEAGSP